MANDFESRNTNPGDLKAFQHLVLRLATIVRVDYSKMTVDVKWLGAAGGRQNVPMTQAYWSYEAFLGAVPEEGALCIIGFYAYGSGTSQPVILGYLPAAPLAARRIESQQVGLPPTGDDDPRNDFSRVQRSRLRKIYPGQILFQSSEGSDILLTDDILLQNSMGNELNLRESDQTIVANALGHVTNFPGGFTKMGAVTRNFLVIDDHVLRAPDEQAGLVAGRALIDPTEFQAAVQAWLVNPVVLSDGKKVNFICDLPMNPAQGGSPFTEHRTEIYEYTPQTMQITEDTDHLPSEREGAQRALVELVMGTLVGKNSGDQETYGRVLKAKMFEDIYQSSGNLSLEEATKSFGFWRENELRSTAIAYWLQVGGYKQAITKTGNVYVDIPASTQSSDLGEGYSLEADLKGAAKISLGKEREKGTSLYLTAPGAIKAVVSGGQQDENGEKGRAIDLAVGTGVNIEVGTGDADQHSWREVLGQKKRVEVGGDNTMETKGNYNLLVHGVINEEVLGKKVCQYIGGRNTNMGGDDKKTMTGRDQYMLGQGRGVTIASGGENPIADNLLILAGNKLTTVALGTVTEIVTAGASTENIPAGAKTFNIGTGAFTVTVASGAIAITTGAGAISITTGAGAMTLTASGVVQVTGGIVNVTGGAVNLGTAPIGGVVTTLSPCLVTGAPHIGSLTVRAGP